MKKSKKSKQLNYFKKWQVMQGISGAVIVIGGLIWWYAYEIWFIGTPIMIVGAAGLVISSFLKVSDNDYEEHLKLLIKGLNKPKSEEKPYISLNGFLIHDTEFAKIRKDGKLCTEKYYMCDIFVSNSQVRAEFSYADAKEERAWSEEYILEKDKTEASVDEEKFNRSGISKTVALMKLCDGKTECVMPVPMNDIAIDKLVEKINTRK